MKIVWTTTALRRLADIARDLDQHDAVAAREFVDAVFAKVETLATFPESGRMVPELNRANLREVFVGTYRVVYGLKGSVVSVRTVRHTREHR